MVLSSGMASDSLNPTNSPHRLRLVQKVFHRRVAEVVGHLHHVNPLHHRQRVGPASSAGFGVVGLDALFQPLPWHKRVELFEKSLPTGLMALVLVVEIGEGGLVCHGVLPYNWLSRPHYATNTNRKPAKDLFRVALELLPVSSYHVDGGPDPAT